MISLVNIAKNLLESYYDDEYGFVDASLEERTPNMDVLVTYSGAIGDWGLVKKKDSKDTYVIDLDDVPYDYYQGYYHWINDDDPDFEDNDSWQDAYREFDDDTQLYESGVAFYAEDLITTGDELTTTVSEIFENNDIKILLITPENKADVYREFEELIKAYLEPSYEERKKEYEKRKIANNGS